MNFDIKKFREQLAQYSETVSKSVDNVVADTPQPPAKINFNESHLLAGLLIILPVFFLPVVANWYDLPKQTLLLIGAGIVTIIWLMRSAVTHKIILNRSPFDVAIFLLPVVAFVSAWLTPNRVSSLITDPLLYGGCALLFLAVTQSKRSVIGAFLAGGAVLAIWTIVKVAISLLSLVVKNPLTNISWVNLGFDPTGSPLSGALTLAILLPVAWGYRNKAFQLILAFGLLASGYVLYKNPPVMLSIETGWKIAAGTMGQSAVSAVLGVGPGHFIDAFNNFRPTEFNLTPYWNLRFTAGANYYFYLLATLGIAGLATFLWLAARLLKIAGHNFESASKLDKGLLAGAILTLAILLFSPAPTTLMVAFFVILALYAREHSAEQTVNLPSNLMAFTPAIAAAGLTVFAGFHLIQFLRADYHFAQSLVAAAANKGTETYNNQIQAINLNPYNDQYHLSYSQTNLALADSLASQQNLTDQQKQAVVQLVQQAIREGRTAAALEPKRSGNWENLSLIYRSLINFAQGSDQWAVSSLNQAINLDPVNPRLRLDLGGIYFAAKDFVTAAQMFNQAINLKTDFANAHYNLAQALKNLNMKDQAAEQLQLTAGLICVAGTQNADCDRVNLEITELASTPATPAATATPSGQTPLATSSAENKNLPKAKTTPAPKISSPSGEITP